MPGSRSWKESVDESELAPAELGFARIAASSVAGGADAGRGRASRALPPTLNGAEEEAVAGEALR